MLLKKRAMVASRARTRMCNIPVSRYPARTEQAVGHGGSSRASSATGGNAEAAWQHKWQRQQPAAASMTLSDIVGEANAARVGGRHGFAGAALMTVRRLRESRAGQSSACCGKSSHMGRHRCPRWQYILIIKRARGQGW